MDAFNTEWFRRKTGKVENLSFFIRPDNLWWTCVYHALASVAFLINDPTSEIFPSVDSMVSLNRALKTLYENYNSDTSNYRPNTNPKDVSSHSIRKFSKHYLDNSGLEVPQINVRFSLGSSTGSNISFTYGEGNVTADVACGRVMAGWKCQPGGVTGGGYCPGKWHVNILLFIIF